MRKALLALAMLAAGPALAVVSSSATMTQSGYTLVDLDPNDGIVAALTWGAPTATPAGRYAQVATYSGGVGTVSGSFTGAYTTESVALQPHYASFLTVTNPFTLSANTAVTFDYAFGSTHSFASGITTNKGPNAIGSVLEPGSSVGMFASFQIQGAFGSAENFSQLSTNQAITVAYSNLTGSAYAGDIGYRLFTSDVSPQWAREHIEPPIVSPVPEPETYAMMLLGLGVMGLAAKRRKVRGWFE